MKTIKLKNILRTVSTDKLNNTGGPRSRTKSLQITSSYTESPNLAEDSTSLSLLVPQGQSDIENWLTKQAKKMGCSSIAEAQKKLSLPGERMLVNQTGESKPKGNLKAPELIRTALILARCNDSFYLPGSPLIFTRNRLNRSIQLIRINIKNYYELD